MSPGSLEKYNPGMNQSNLSNFAAEGTGDILVLLTTKCQFVNWKNFQDKQMNEDNEM